MKGVFQLVAVGIALGGCGPQFFVCENDGACGPGAVCADNGYCAFTDPDCDSGYRYGEYSPLAGECLDPTAGTSGSGGDVPDPLPSTSSSSSSGPDPSAGEVAGLETTWGVSEGSGSGSEDTGWAVVCGDGFVDGDEGCDDGNTADDDGCNSACQVSGELRWLHTFDEPGRARAVAATEDRLVVVGAVDSQSHRARLSFDGLLEEEVVGDAFPGDVGAVDVAADGGHVVVLGAGHDGVGEPLAWVANLQPDSLEVTDLRTLWTGRALDIVVRGGLAYIGGAEGATVPEEALRLVSLPIPIDARVAPESLFAPDIGGVLSQVAVDIGVVAAGIRSPNSWQSGTAVAFAGVPMNEQPVFEADSAFGYAFGQALVCESGACFLGGFVNTAPGLGNEEREAKVWRIDDGQSWTASFDGGSATMSNEVEALALLPDGDVVAGGFLSTPGSGADLWVSRLSPEGEERWRWVADVAGNDRLRDVLVHDGRIFVAGETGEHGFVAEVTR